MDFIELATARGDISRAVMALSTAELSPDDKQAVVLEEAYRLLVSAGGRILGLIRQAGGDVEAAGDNSIEAGPALPGAVLTDGSL